MTDVSRVESRPVRHSLGAEELVELGRPVPMFRYAHTPFLANRARMGAPSEVPLAQPVNLLRVQENLFRSEALGQAAPAAAPPNVTRTLAIGIPVAGAAAILLALMR